MDLNDALAETINEERVAQHLSVAMLVVRSGIPDRTLWRYLHGQRQITIGVLEMLASALKKKPSTLLRAAEKRSKDE